MQISFEEVLLNVTTILPTTLQHNSESVFGLEGQVIQNPFVH